MPCKRWFQGLKKVMKADWMKIVRVGLACAFCFAGMSLLVGESTAAPTKHVLRAKPIAAVVVEAEIGTPVAGAVVAAYWNLKLSDASANKSACNVSNIQEAVTGPDGKFHLPGWGPISSKCGKIVDATPLLLVFKQGYAYGHIGDGDRTAASRALGKEFGVNHKIELHRLPKGKIAGGSPDSPLMNFTFFNQEFITLVTQTPQGCYWKKLPNMLKAIAAVRQSFDQMSDTPVDALDTWLLSNDQYLLQVAPQCGSPKAFIEGLRK